jgi:hypothetical protein
MHRPNRCSYPGRAATEPGKPTGTLRGPHSFDHCKGCVRGDYHYEGRQDNQPIIEINQRNSHISLIIGIERIRDSSKVAGCERLIALESN